MITCVDAPHSQIHLEQLTFKVEFELRGKSEKFRFQSNQLASRMNLFFFFFPDMSSVFFKSRNASKNCAENKLRLLPFTGLYVCTHLF